MKPFVLLLLTLSFCLATSQLNSNYWNFISRYEWNLIQINGRLLQDLRLRAFLKFDIYKMSFRGLSGCNRIFGKFVSSGNNITFENIGITKMSCSGKEGALETEFLSILKKTALTFDVADQVLNIYSEDKIVLMLALSSVNEINEIQSGIWKFIAKHDWNLIQINGETLTQSKATLKFDISQRKISGSGGCNRFFGDFTVDTNKISFSSVGMTQMFCEGDAGRIENELIQVLGKAGLTFDVAEQVLNIYLNDKIVLMFGLSLPKSVGETKLNEWNFIGKRTWRLAQLNGVAITNTQAFIKFNTVNNKINGKGGCNRFSGNYTAESEEISFLLVGSSKMFCEGEVGKQEAEFFGVLEKAGLTFDVSGHVLNINSENKTVLVFEMIKQDYLNVLGTEKWSLVQINGRELEKSPSAFIKFDVPLMKVSGNSGCNYFFGSFSSTEEGNIRFPNLGLTKMACPGPAGELETEVMKALDLSDLNFFIVGDILSITSNDTVVLKFLKGIAPTKTILDMLANREWKLNYISSMHLEKAVATLTMLKEGYRIYGKTGCNNFFGTFNLSLAETEFGYPISFSPFATTKMACQGEKRTLEAEFLRIMAQKDLTLIAKTNDTLSLYSAEKELMGFTYGNATKTTLNKDILSLLGKFEWTLTEVEGQKLLSTKATLKFDISTKKISGSGGCNRYFGGFSLNDNILNFSNIGSTLMFCSGEQGKIEMLFMRNLGHALTFEVSNNSLKFFSNGKLVLSFGAQVSVGQAIMGRKWVLATINGASYQEAKANINFEEKENRVFGNTGCNSFSGKFSLSENRVQFSYLAMTEMACMGEGGVTESNFMKAINTSDLNFEVSGGSLTLSSGGVALMTFNAEN